MAGYSWNNGMSNNAVAAYRSGEMPLSKIRKSDVDSAVGDLPIKITMKFIKWLAKNEHWTPASWHHTSKYFNETNFYDLEELNEVLEEDGEKLLAEFKEDERIQKTIKTTDVVGKFWMSGEWVRFKGKMNEATGTIYYDGEGERLKSSGGRAGFGFGRLSRADELDSREFIKWRKCEQPFDHFTS